MAWSTEEQPPPAPLQRGRHELYLKIDAFRLFCPSAFPPVRTSKWFNANLALSLSRSLQPVLKEPLLYILSLFYIQTSCHIYNFYFQIVLYYILLLYIYIIEIYNILLLRIQFH